MRTITKIVLVIIIITFVYSVVKLINASAPQEQTVATITWPVNQQQSTAQNSQANTTNTQQSTQQIAQQNTAQNANQNTASQSVQTVYQADEVLIDGQGVAGENYIDITSNTPITSQQIAQAKSTPNTQNNGGAYAEASVSINNNNASNTAQYAPGMPAFEVIDGN